VLSLDGSANMGEAAGFAHGVGRLLVERYPKELTLEFQQKDRAGRILVDTGWNDYSATFAAAYAVRARAGAPVSAPCTWDEIERGEVGPQTFTLRAMADRLTAVGDLWSGIGKDQVPLRQAIKRLAKLEARHVKAEV